MPYPEETGRTPDPPQRDGTLSEAEKHWNQVILALLAIGTTILGVTLVVYGRSSDTPNQENLFRLIQATATVSALVIYLAAFLYTARTLFLPTTPVGPPRLAQKRSMASTVVTLSALLAMMAATVIFIEIVSPNTNSPRVTTSEEPVKGELTEDAEENPAFPEPTPEIQVPTTEPALTPTPYPTLK